MNTIIIDHSLGQTKNFTMKKLKNNFKNHLQVNNSLNFNESLNNIYNNINNFNCFFGGDHSIAIATISKIYKSGMKIIWIDAHPDINTFESSITGNIHGMPLAFLTHLESQEKLEDKYQTKLDFNIPKIPFEDILYIGIRDIDPFELEIINKYSIKYISKFDNFYNIKEDIKTFIGDSTFHISFDVDSLDPEVMPCTGTRVNNGISKENAKLLLDYLLLLRPNSLDITELNLNEYPIKKKEETFNLIYETVSLNTLKELFKNYFIFLN